MYLLKNKKGFVVEGVVIVAVGITLLLTTFWKPLSSTVGSFIGSNRPQKVSKSYYKKAESAPMFYMNEKGKLVPAPQPYKLKIESSEALSEEAQLTLWQKIKNLGIVGIIMVIACFLYPPLGILVMAIIKKISNGAKKAIDTANSQLKSVDDGKKLLEDQAEQIAISVKGGLATIKNSMDIC